MSANQHGCLPDLGAGSAGQYPGEDIRQFRPVSGKPTIARLLNSLSGEFNVMNRIVAIPDYVVDGFEYAPRVESHLSQPAFESRSALSQRGGEKSQHHMIVAEWPLPLH